MVHRLERYQLNFGPLINQIRSLTAADQTQQLNAFSCSLPSGLPELSWPATLHASVSPDLCMHVVLMIVMALWHTMHGMKKKEEMATCVVACFEVSLDT